MHHPLKIANTLADETRYSIYELFLQTQQAYTVQQIANHFNIHPNVARSHLTKLAEIQIIEADYEKTGKGGRPGRIYKVSNNPVQLSIPKKEQNQLLLWTLQLVETLGEDGLLQAKHISYQDGIQTIETLKRTRSIYTYESKLALLKEAAATINYVPSSKEIDSHIYLSFTIYSCPYHNYATAYRPIIVSLHEGYIQGLVDALFDLHEKVILNGLENQCPYCQSNNVLLKR